MARDKWWWRRQDHAQGRYAPRLWPVWPVAISAVVVASALAWVIFLRLRAVTVPHAAPNGGTASIDPLDVIKTTITVAGFVGAVLVGVYGYRKQRLVEGDARRADAEQLAQRYTTAADQLGHEKAAVRLAGVYAMARLADDWIEQRQVCTDVLCAYLRMPYTPPDDRVPAEDASAEAHTRYEQRRQELQVRLTAQRLLAAYLRPDPSGVFWTGIDLDLTEAHLYRLDLTNCHIRIAQFSGSQFGGDARFDKAHFGGAAWFDQTQFGTAWFDEAQFDYDAWFAEAQFGEAASFSKVRVRRDCGYQSWPAGWTSRNALVADGEEEGWMYLVRIDDSTE